MTLMLFHCFKDSFVIATSDTKEVFRHLLSDDNDGIIWSRDDANDKAIHLTDNVLMAAGGVSWITDDWKRYMKKHVKKELFLDDLLEIATISLEYLKEKEEREEIYKEYLNSPYVMLRLIGYLKNGKTGVIRRYQGKFELIEVGHDEMYSNMFAPTKEISDKSELMMDYSNEEPGRYESVIEYALARYRSIHSIVATYHPDVVSDQLIVHVLAKENGKIEYISYQEDLSEFVKELSAM